MTRKELEALGLEKEAIDKIMKINGDDIENAKTKSSGDVTALTADKKALEMQLETIKQEKVELEKLSGDTEAYKIKVAELEKKEADRLALETKLKEDGELLAKIAESVKEKEFINEFTKNAIVGEVKTKLTDKAYVGKSINDILEEVTKDKDVYKNPQGATKIPPVGNTNIEKAVSLTEALREKYK